LPLAQTAKHVSLTLFLLLAAAILAALALAFRRRGSRRQQAVSELLDAADALEERLRTARAEIEAIAGSDDNPVRDAMHEMLRQRLWLQQHGSAASLEQIDSVRASIDAARERIDQQLLQIERARAPLH
jgi:methyl-accepting chemotaxis protein